MKKIIYALLATVAGLVLLLSYRTSLGASLPDTTTHAGTTGAGSTTGSGASTPSYKNGTFTGQAADTQWGPVQVAITVSGGAITAVDVPVSPDGNGRDQQINAVALPQLVSETLTAQSAKIDMVSGATYTSQGYLQSLQSAIDQATS